MQFFFDQSTIQIIKPLAAAFLGLISLTALAYTFNKSKSDDLDSDDAGQVVSADKKKPAGIYNEGNTCFVNSLLQALAPLKLFVANLEQLILYREDTQDQHANVLIQLKKALNKINSSEGSVEIHGFLQAVGQFSDLINLQQQDAYELFSIIVDCLEKIYNQNKSASLNRSTLSNDEGDIEETFINCSVDNHNQQSNALLGYTKTSLQCQGCLQQITTKIHPFFNISFSISPQKITSLQSAIAHFQQKQKIQGFICTYCSLKAHINKLKEVGKQIQKYKPQNYKILLQVQRKIIQFLGSGALDSQREIWEVNLDLGKFVEAFQNEYTVLEGNLFRERVFVQIQSVSRTVVKQCVISKFPKILALHLNQLSINPFTGEPVLLRKHIQSPEKLTIKVKKGQKNYELMSLISHTGDESQGHYFTFRRMSRQSKDWFCISDTQSFKCRDTFLRAYMPYMLFYEVSE